ncbi:MAG: transposase, partial [Candidatus Paceibacteria bacterium]
MSKNTGKRYSSDFKAKVVLELLEGEKPLNQLCSEYGLTPKSVQSWKDAFIKNASLAFNIEGAVSEYKQSIKDKEQGHLIKIVYLTRYPGNFR